MAGDLTIFRKLLTVCLSASVALTSFAPAIALAPVDAPPVIDDQQRDCCCGSDQGACCGMTCCEVQSPELPKTPVLPPHRSESPRPLVVWHAAELAPVVRDLVSSLARRAAAEPPAQATETSLQALQVRLDI